MKKRDFCVLHLLVNKVHLPLLLTKIINNLLVEYGRDFLDMESSISKMTAGKWKK